MSCYPKLVAELLRRGYSDEDAKKVIGNNLITAMEKMEKVSKKIYFASVAVWLHHQPSVLFS